MNEALNIDNIKSIQYVSFERTYRFKTTTSYPFIRVTKKFPFIKFLRKKDCTPDEVSFCIWDEWSSYTPESLAELNYTVKDNKIYINPHVLIKYIDGSKERIYYKTEEEATKKYKELLKRFKRNMVLIS